MDLEITEWDQADKDFGLWEKEQNIISKPLTEILKSTYFVFREKQRSWIHAICTHSFELFNEKNQKQENKFTQLSEINFFEQKSSEVLEDNLAIISPAFMLRPKSVDIERKTKDKNEKIINGILSGDQQVFNDLYEYEFPKVVRLITLNSGNVDSAKDIFQDGLITFMEKLYKNEIDLTCSVSTYLYSICRNLWMEQLRKDKMSESFNDYYNYLEFDFPIHGNETTPDLYEDVNKVIDSMGNPCKQLLECYYYKKLSWEKIAQMLDYSNAASARNQKYKCLERIRNSINKVE